MGRDTHSESKNNFEGLSSNKKIRRKKQIHIVHCRRILIEATGITKVRKRKPQK